MNLLSVGAAYGLLVLVFQEGVGNELLGLREAETIDAWVPLFLFAVLFGLSMDYQVFLLSRIRERYTQTGDTDAAISFGIGSTARLITGAALIIIAVFWGFAMGDTIAFQQMGFGIAVALLIDATIVRSVLVPATMKLLGERNWYLPSWLSWLPDVHVEGAEPPRARPLCGRCPAGARSSDDALEEARRHVRRKRIFYTVLGVWIALCLMWFVIDLARRQQLLSGSTGRCWARASAWPSPESCCSGSAGSSAPTGSGGRSTSISAAEGTSRAVRPATR